MAESLQAIGQKFDAIYLTPPTQSLPIEWPPQLLPPSYISKNSQTYPYPHLYYPPQHPQQPPAHRDFNHIHQHLYYPPPPPPPPPPPSPSPYSTNLHHQPHHLHQMPLSSQYH
ncbi:hypothetical protein PHAVU_002G014000 [Phaseolus vulgaris]|uniref:Uncharacterized protein n=1 Tax=Phaseolus vulgaris TaxID=3885 RepID=V7CEZ2_PHAVU|nr:hypothetical protein PHAVU_002G014000g [Phaseolus vulgaris]ESW28742.1 hypothetical protein PHAVU_002G014000g [Phaseolus vulgaris]